MSGNGGARWGRRYNRVVEQHMGGASPEVRFVLALLARGLIDAMNGDPGGRMFVASADFDFWCESVGISPALIRDRLAAGMMT